MKTYQKTIYNSNEIENIQPDFSPDVILMFVSPGFENFSGFLQNLKSKYPDSICTGCSTSGEIHNISIHDNSVNLTAIQFDSTRVELIVESISGMEKSEEVGEKISDRLISDDLKHVLIFSDGLNVNGANLVRGLKKHMLKNVAITGGLAGDGANFQKTFVIADDHITDKKIVGLGFYGDKLNVGCGSKGGWDSYGMDRLVTRSENNVLYELDGQPALELYKSFLGDKAKELPGSGLLFPLSLCEQGSSESVVRTILAVNEADQSLTFAGNIPEGSHVKLMKANVDKLIDGAHQSAKISSENKKDEVQLAILISCVGRRLVLKQFAEEEVEAVRDVLGNTPIITGFYSYGEIAPFGDFSPCQLHNQTMTITTFSED